MNQPLTPMQDLAEELQQASRRALALAPTTEELARNLAAAGRTMNERMPTMQQLSASFAKAASAFR